jgi:hypothetical protein
MKKYLLWKKSEEDLESPRIAAQAPDTFLHLPTISADSTDYPFDASLSTDLSSSSATTADDTAALAALSPTAAAAIAAHASAFSAVQHPQPAVLTGMSPALLNHYQSLMCIPVLLDRLGPHILRSHMSTAQFKPIPNNERVDLDRFRLREPQEWGMDDVVAWMIAVARHHQIPVEDMNMHKYASCTGPLLLLMSEQHFVDRDPNYGQLLYREFRKLVTDDNSFLDDWMRAYKEDNDEQQPSTSRYPTQPAPQQLHPIASKPSIAKSSGAHLLSTQQQRLNAMDAGRPGPSGAGDSSMHGVNLKIRKNKDGRPRKRSQHTKGNKLWEFIRDALKDPSTCPSVVRWEDPIEGVFRIVESEKLARLWGEKKNNQKMTYEKLSRAMRTYYEKHILVPVPKTGLYPKKLVYKFGPSAFGWSANSGTNSVSSRRVGGGSIVKMEQSNSADDDIAVSSHVFNNSVQQRRC